MTTRTSKQTVTFKRPFVLSGLDRVLPAGAYSVETDEALLEGLSFPAYRRVLTVIHLRPERGRPGVTETLAIDPNDLDAALKRDQAPAEISFNWDSSTGRSLLARTTNTRRKETEYETLDRADDDGMIIGPD
jgi:hypothetical protein